MLDEKKKNIKLIGKCTFKVTDSLFILNYSSVCL